MVDIFAHMESTIINKFILMIAAGLITSSNFLTRTFAQELQSMHDGFPVSADTRTDLLRHDDVTDDVTDKPGYFKCYTCGAYRHSDGDAFQSKLKACREQHAEESEIVTCPRNVAGQSTKPQCGITKQTIKGHVTSFSRGCHYLVRCAELRDCYHRIKDFTGVCQYCCNTTLCNQGTHLVSFSWSLFFMSSAGLLGQILI